MTYTPGGRALLLISAPRTSRILRSPPSPVRHGSTPSQEPSEHHPERRPHQLHAGSLLQISKQASTLTDDQETIERVLTLATELVAAGAKAYRLADENVKRMFNQIFFKRLLVLDNDDIRVELAEPIATITSSVVREHMGGSGVRQTKERHIPEGSYRSEQGHETAVRRRPLSVDCFS